MNDRYLFKAKRLDNGEWEIGSLIALPTGEYEISNKCNNPPDCDPMWDKVVITHKVDPTTICQCTGLKDKNGNLIWENDIASYSDLITRDKKTICIEWNKIQASFVRKYRSPMGLQYLYLDEYIASRMAVIGNIFDNPELLESEE